MNIFILCTGRCGSASFVQACQQIKNYSSGHESLANKFGESRFDYPDNHIETDNRLSWHLGQLDNKYGDEAFYVHLKRNKEEVARSYSKRFYIPGSIMDAFCGGIRKSPPERLTEKERYKACFDYVDTVTINIEHFLINKSKVMVINLEDIEDDFKEFWSQIGAIGDIEAALDTFKVKNNKTKKRKLNIETRLRYMIKREWRHIKMCLQS